MIFTPAKLMHVIYHTKFSIQINVYEIFPLEENQKTNNWELNEEIFLSRFVFSDWVRGNSRQVVMLADCAHVTLLFLYLDQLYFVNYHYKHNKICTINVISHIKTVSWFVNIFVCILYDEKICTQKCGIL